MMQQLTLDEASPAAGQPEKLAQLIGSVSGSGSVIARTFDLMRIAEEEVDRAKVMHPEKAERLHRSFGELCPPAGMATFAPDVYRSHARELLDQVARGEERTATHSEIVIALRSASLKAPIPRDFSAAYWLACKEVLGSKVEHLSDDWFTANDIQEGRDRLAEVRRDLTRKIQAGGAQ